MPLCNRPPGPPIDHREANVPRTAKKGRFSSADFTNTPNKVSLSRGPDPMLTPALGKIAEPPQLISFRNLLKLTDLSAPEGRQILTQAQALGSWAKMTQP